MDNNDKKAKTKVYLVIMIAFLVIATFGITYSYFSSKKDVQNTANLNLTSGGSYTLIMESDEDIEYDVALASMYSENINTVSIAGDNANIMVSLKSPSEDVTVLCDFDIVWIWDSENQIIEPSAPLPIVVEDKTYNYEFSVKIDKSVTDDTSGYVYQDANLPETNLSDFDWSEETGVVGNEAILIKKAQIASRSTNATVATWNITSNLYNIPAPQNDLGGKSYFAKVTATNLNCKMYDETP